MKEIVVLKHLLLALELSVFRVEFSVLEALRLCLMSIFVVLVDFWGF